MPADPAQLRQLSDMRNLLDNGTMEEVQAMDRQDELIWDSLLAGKSMILGNPKFKKTRSISHHKRPQNGRRHRHRHHHHHHQ